VKHDVSSAKTETKQSHLLRAKQFQLSRRLVGSALGSDFGSNLINMRTSSSTMTAKTSFQQPTQRQHDSPFQSTYLSTGAGRGDGRSGCHLCSRGLRRFHRFLHAGTILG
jgi:hypothetical protein